MTLIRLLLIAAIVWFAFTLIRRYLAASRPVSRLPRETRMVRCALCALHVPEAEAVHGGGKSYCCRDHLDRDQRQRRS